MTVVNDSGSLDSGLSAMYYGVQAADVIARAYTTDLQFGPLSGGSIPSNATTALDFSGSTLALGDKMSECATGVFTPKVAGTYLVTFVGELVQASATTVVLGSPFFLALYVNGSSFLSRAVSWPFPAGTTSSSDVRVPINLQIAATLAAAGTAQLRVITPTYTGTVTINGTMAVRRLGV